MHPRNFHIKPYDFDALIRIHPPLSEYVFVNIYGTRTVDFNDSDAILNLNKALLKEHYNVPDWNIPPNYLCPPIPGRADYIHHISDLIAPVEHTQVKGLDVGVGANCIYSILGSQIYGWKMVGVDIDPAAIVSAQANVKTSEELQQRIQIRHQSNNANIFAGIINKDEYFHFSMCNPPFHTSEEEATKASLRKRRNLKKKEYNFVPKKVVTLNFGGQSNELWCNGGEKLFIKRMIKQSIHFKNQVGWFTTLVSKNENLPNIYKQLEKLQASFKTISMEQGNKQSRFVAWRFN